MGRPKKQPTSDFVTKHIHQNAMAFCISNGIQIHPIMLKDKEFKLNIRIDRGGLIKNIESPVNYSKHELTGKIYELYLHYFKKMAGADVIRKSRKKYISFKNNT
jgi:hypothetical protein